MAESAGIVIVGLGPGMADQVTREAWALLQAANEIYVRTEHHPTVGEIRGLIPSLRVRSFDHLYMSHSTFEGAYGAMVDELVTRAQVESVVYCVPGSPLIDESTVEMIREQAATHEIPVRMIHGVSYLEAVLGVIPPSAHSWLCTVDAVELDIIASANAAGEVPGRDTVVSVKGVLPAVPLLISQVYDRDIAASVKLWLTRFWPDEHEVSVVRAAGTGAEAIDSVVLHELDRQSYDHLTSVYVPALEPIDDVRTFTGLLEVTRALRGPGGCPWDREQTHTSLKPYLVEEAYEVIEALDAEDYDQLCGELGDLLFQITIHAQVAAEAGEFDISDVIEGIATKLKRRHPHVFGDVDLPTSTLVLRHWEVMKQEENPERPSVLSGIPMAMPALPYSFAVQKRVANQGFDWHDPQSVLDKVTEELAELRVAVTKKEGRGRIIEELGDVIFALVSVGRWVDADPEEALRHANRKFVKRFGYAEALCKKRSRVLRELTPEEIDQLWEESKAGVG